MTDTTQKGSLYTVGKLYSPTRTDWPDHDDYNYRAGCHELRIFRRKISALEDRCFHKSSINLSITVVDSAIFVCYEFVGLDWCDTTFNWWLMPEDERILPPEPVPGADHALLHVLCVEGTTGILTAYRAVTFSPKVTKYLHDAIRAQSETPWPGGRKHDDALAKAYLRYPTSRQMALASVHRCRGGS